MTKKFSFKKIMAILVLALLLILAFAPLTKAYYWYFTNVNSRTFTYNFTSQYIGTKARNHDATTSSETYRITQGATVLGAPKLDYIERSYQGRLGKYALQVSKIVNLSRPMSGRVEYA